MHVADEYPITFHPSGLEERRPQTWTDDKASGYFDWIVDTFEQRTDALLRYFDEDFSKPSVDLLRSLGSRVEEN